ncbi:MAG: transcription termination factor Rho [Euzebyales bacterium]|nr:transcription termination factor Rho [Euzebyales bacterium]
MDPSVLASKQLTELKTIASSLQMRGYQRLKKAELVDAIVRTANDQPDSRPDQARSEISDNGGASAPRNGRGSRERAARRQRGPSAERPGNDGSDDDDGSAARTRVRTRTRERTEQERAEQERAESGDVAAVIVTERGDGSARSDGQAGARRDLRTEPAGEHGERQQEGAREQQDQARGDRQDQARGDQEADRQQPDPNRGEQRGGNRQQQDSAQDAGSRKRRSRRERRRNKGGGGGGQGKQQKGGQRPEEDLTAEPGEVRSGVLDVLPEGYGFLRVSSYLPGDRDVYVSQSHIRKHGLRRGDVIEGPIRQQRSSEKVPALHHVQQVNGLVPDENGNLPHRPDFKDMTPLFPDERLPLETPEGPVSMRIVDLMSTIGKGQRGLIVSPPKAGKTTILKELGQAIAFNNPECHLMVVLVDERPEEVTDMQRSVPGEIVAATFDRPADDHTQIAELAIERAKRLVEQGRDVVILLDSITRLSRAYNNAAPASGRIMSGGVDSTALYPPKRFFGAARNIEHGGSLTIIATALIETGSKMDEVIFEEFKGTGNMELRLDRRLEQKRIFPAIDIGASGTRKEELLLDKEELLIIWKLRRVLHALDGPAALELLIDKMKTTKSNNQFLIQIQKSNLQT